MRLTRAEIAEWYRACPIPDKDGIVFRAMLDDDRLILGVYSARERCGIYILHRDGRRATKRDKLDAWGTEGIRYILGGNWYYGVNRYGMTQGFSDYESEIVAMQYINEQCTHYTEIVDKLMSIDDKCNAHKREVKAQNKNRRMMSFVNALPPLPKGFAEWCHRVPFGGLHYMFGKAGSDTYHCTACSKKHEIKRLKDRQTTICSRTGLEVSVTKRRNLIEQRASIMLLQNVTEPHAFEECSVLRRRYIYGKWSSSGFNLENAGDDDDGDYMVVLLPKGGDDARRWFYQYNGWFGSEWSEHNRANVRLTPDYLFPDTVNEALDNTCYKHLGIDVAAFKGWKLNYSHLMIDHSRKQTEYLIKGGFRRLVRDIADRSVVATIPRSSKDIRSALMLNGQSVARLRQLDGGMYTLCWLRNVDMCGERLSDDHLRKLEEYEISPTKLAKIINYGIVSATQTLNYIEKQLKLRGRDMTRIMVHSLIEEWKDYLSMAEKLKLDTYNEIIFRPKDLKARHDELSELIAAERDKEECARIEREYPEIAPACQRIKSLYEWQDEKYIVTVPSGAADIMREGRLLKHCVGSSDRYFDRISEGESYIMFLRKKTSPATPWYTIEVEPGGKVRQLRTIGDAEGKDRNEAKDALKSWRAEINARLRKTKAGEGELAAAAVSREKRLAEFEELRKNGNIIRNGKLAGRLLVEVLEADFREYNDEETA